MKVTEKLLLNLHIYGIVYKHTIFHILACIYILINVIYSNTHTPHIQPLMLHNLLNNAKLECKERRKCIILKSRLNEKNKCILNTKVLNLKILCIDIIRECICYASDLNISLYRLLWLKYQLLLQLWPSLSFNKFEKFQLTQNASFKPVKKHKHKKDCLQNIMF